MKKVLLLGQIPKEMGGSYTTGVANVIMELSKRFSENYDVHIFASNFNRKNKIFNSNIQIWGIDKKTLLIKVLKKIIKKPFNSIKILIEYRVKYGLEPLRSFVYFSILSDCIEFIMPDLIQAHGVIWLPILKNITNKIPIIETFHGIFIDDKNAIKYNLTKDFNLTKMFYNSAKLVNHCTVLTDEMKDIAINRLGIVENKIFQISNGIDIEKFYYDNEKRKQIREKYEIGGNDKVFITVASLSARKGQKRFIKFLAKNYIEAFYWIIGSGSAKNEIINLIKALNLADRIKLFDFIPNNRLYEYYSAADFYAHTSSSEGQSLSAIEAAATGLKLIVNKEISGTLGFSEIIENQIYIHNINDNINIDISNFDRFYKTQLDREKISKNRIKFSWETFAKQYVQYFEKIIN